MKNTKIKNVLIALDYNPTAQKIAELGFAFATAMQAKITLATIYENYADYTPVIYDPIMGFTGYTESDKISQELILTKSQKFLEKTKKHLGDENISIIVKEGSSAKEILNIAKEIKADLIVIGSHSKKWLDKLIIGSTTEKVLKHSKIPMLIIPTKG
jgi:nucleotide-binding universal stress UspA family protein